MSRLKVLQLDGWMSSEFLRTDSIELDPTNYRKIEPIMQRDGVYLATDGSLELESCWFEVNGEAYTYPAEQFRYTLDILDTWQRYNHRQIDALKQIINQKLATKQQRILWWRWRDAQKIRQSGREARIIFNRV